MKLDSFPWDKDGLYSTSATPKHLWTIGAFFVCIYAFTKIAFPELGRISELVTVLLGLAVIFLYKKQMRGDTALWLLLFAMIIPIISWAFAKGHHPELIEAYPKLDRTAKLFLFIPIAVWLGGSTRNTLLLWLIASVGFFVSLFFHGDGLQEWLRGLQGERVDFGIRNAQHTAMFFGVIFLGLVTLTRRIVFTDRLVPWRLACWILATLLAVTGVVITQTRAVWIGVIASLALLLLLVVIYTIRHNNRGHLLKHTKLITFVLVVSTLSAIWLLKDYSGNRFAGLGELAQQVASGERKNIPFEGGGVRLHSWLVAYDWFIERPVIGWGGNAGSFVIDESNKIPDWMKDMYGHLHNSYLQIAVSYGMLGIVFSMGVIGWLFYACWRAWRANALPGDLGLFGVIFSIYWLVVNIFESYIIFWTGVFTMSIVVGGLYTHYWRWRYGNARNTV